MPSRTQGSRSAPRSAPHDATRPGPQTARPQTAVAVFDPDEAARKIKVLVENREEQFAALLSADRGTPLGKATVERFITVALEAITSRRDLLDADPLSLVSAVRTAAQYGLEPSGVLGDGVIIARRDRNQGGKKIATFEPMYRGLAKLVRRHPSVSKIDWQLVYEKDSFRYRPLDNPPFDHERFVDGDPGAIKGAYCVIVLRDGEMIPTYMSTAEILKVRNEASRAWQDEGDKSLWGKWADSMMLKTVVKRGAKKAPLDSLAQQLIAYDDQNDAPVRVSMPERPAIGAGLRTRLGLEAGEAGRNGSGDAEAGETDKEATPDANGAQGPSTAATEPTKPTAPDVDPAELVAVTAVELCDEPNPYDDGVAPNDPDFGGPCVHPKDHKAGKSHGGHKARNGATW